MTTLLQRRPTPAKEVRTATVAAPERPPRHPGVVASRALTAGAVLFNLWFLRAERLVVNYPNDSQTHRQMVVWATQMLSHGLLPFGQWYAHLSLGSPFFVQYQSASAVLDGAVGLVIGPRQAYAWSLYVLLALWPLCIYATGRLLRWGVWESGLAAAMSPLIYSLTGRGFEHQAYLWLGSGLWSELWAMWTLPLAIGLSWRYLHERRNLFWAVLFMGATISFHFLMAYLGAMFLVLMVLISRQDFWRRAARAGTIGVLSLLTTLWVTLPLLADAKWTALNEFQVHTSIDDSYGAAKVLTWLSRGQIYDSGRFPILTILVAFGLVWCGLRFRRDERARFLAAMWVLSLLLYFGRPTFGFVLDLLPGNKDLLFQRFVAGLDLSGLFLAAVGAVWCVRLAHAGAKQLAPRVVGAAWNLRGARIGAPVLALAVTVLVLAPAWNQVRTYDGYDAAWISYQRGVDATNGREIQALLDLAAQRGGGRVYSGMPSNWGYNFKVGGVQTYIYQENSPVDAVGFTLRGFGLMTDPEAWFDEYNPGDYNVMGIKYLLYPIGKKPPVPATLLTTSGPYALWTVPTSGLIQVVDTTTPIPANASDLGKMTKDFLASSLPNLSVYPTIAYAGSPAAAPTIPFGSKYPKGPAGQVVASSDDLAYGEASATVIANRSSVVLLKSSYDPGWSATVDGRPAKTEMLAPALVGVEVGPGLHRVVFRYHGYGSYPLLFAIASLTLVGIGVGPARWRRVAARVQRARWLPAAFEKRAAKLHP